MFSGCLTHLIHRGHAQNTKTCGYDNGNGTRQRQFRLAGGHVVFLEEAQSVLDALLAYVQDSGELLHLAEVEVERDVLSAQLDPAP